MSVPFMPFYVSDFEADTGHLTIEEDGAYNRLLRLCWRTPTCSIPDDAVWIARRMRVDADTYERIVKPIIEEYFSTQKGRVYQPRQMAEFDKTQTKIKTAQENGKKGGRPAKSLKNKKKTKTNGFQKPNPEKNYLEPEPYIKDIPKEGISKNAVLFDEFWGLYPNKVGKGAAKIAFSKALKKVDFGEIADGLVIYVSKTDDRPWCNPATWLNQDRWEDQPATIIQSNGKRPTLSQSLMSEAMAPDEPEDAWGGVYANETKLIEG